LRALPNSTGTWTVRRQDRATKQALVPAERDAHPADSAVFGRLFSAADWMGSYYRRCFTLALKARYGLWAIMAFC